MKTQKTKTEAVTKTATRRCVECELARLVDATETFYRTLALVVPIIGLSMTERRVDPARKGAIEQLTGLGKRWAAGTTCGHDSLAGAALVADLLIGDDPADEDEDDPRDEVDEEDDELIEDETEEIDDELTEEDEIVETINELPLPSDDDPSNDDFMSVFAAKLGSAKTSGRNAKKTKEREEEKGRKKAARVERARLRREAGGAL